MPAGFVLHDPLGLVDPVLFRRKEIEVMRPAPADTEAVIFPATISPLKSDTTIASAKDCVAAAAPGDA